jgi:hypothetical protein
MEYTSPSGAPIGGSKHKGRKHIDWAARTIRIEWFIVMIGSALLLAAVALFLGIGNNTGTSQSKLVDTKNIRQCF